MALKGHQVLREMLKIVFSIAVVMLWITISLYLLKKVPSYLKESGEKFYSTVEEAEYSLGLEIPLPSYFPDYLIWPPSEIKVVRNSNITISIAFLSRSSSGPTLLINQIVQDMHANEDATPGVMIPEKPFKETRVSVNGAEASLIVGVREDGKYWKQLSWQAVDRMMVLRGSIAIEDLMKIARSIH